MTRAKARRYQILDAHPLQLVGASLQQLVGLRIGLLDHAVFGDDQQPFRGRLEQLPHAQFAVAQRRRTRVDEIPDLAVATTDDPGQRRERGGQQQSGRQLPQRTRRPNDQRHGRRQNRHLQPPAGE